MHGVYEAEKYCFGTIILRFENNEGKILTTDDIIGSKVNEEDKTTDAITFTYYDNNNNPKTEKIRIDNDKALFIDTSYIVVKNKFYINIDLTQIKTSTLTLKISTDYIQCKAKVYLLETDDVISSQNTVYCLDCLDKINNENSITINGKKYEQISTYTTWAYSSAKKSKYVDYQTLSPIGSAQTESFKSELHHVYYCTNCKQVASETSYTSAIIHLQWCRRSQDNGGKILEQNCNKYWFEITKLKVFENECSNPRCGTTVTENIEQQPLICVDANVKDNVIPVELEYKIPIIPSIELQLEKYNSYDKANKKLNATFKIEANQDGENIYTKEIKVVNGEMYYKESGEKIETIQINPVNKKDIYVKITEIETPTGYNTIEPICIKYTLRENNRMWDLNIINQADDWNEESGFEEEYSNWELHDELEDGTNLPNAYKSPNNNKIIVEQDGENNKIHIFKIYNEPKVDITLIKKDPNNIIEGVKFTGIIENVESFDGSIKNSQGVIPFELTTDANGKIRFSLKNIVFKDGKNTIIIKITGEEVPYSKDTNWYYEKLNVSEDNPVIITLTFNDYKELESVTVNREQEKIIATIDQTNTVTLNVKNPKTVIPNIELNLQKYNSYYATTKKLLSATFKIEAVQNGKTIYSEEKTISDETITITPENKYDIYVKITETKAPAGYSTIDPICIQYTLRDSYYKWDMKMIDITSWPSNKLNYNEWSLFDKLEDGKEDLPNAYATTYKYKNEEKENSVVIVRENGKGYIFEVYNEPKVEIKLTKIDNTSNEALANVKFKGTIENIKYFKDIDNDDVYTINKDNNTIGFNLETDKDGILMLKFENIELLQQNDNGQGTITINIEEVEAPASGTDDWYYKKLTNPITIYLTFDINEGIIDTKYIKWQKNGNEENITLSLTRNEKIIAITVPNIRVINVSGLVWVDGETNINNKTTGPANGIMDGEEKGKKDVIVVLYNEDSKKTESTTYTNENGEYTFENVKYGVNYYVQFVYDGINYEDTQCYTREENKKGLITYSYIDLEGKLKKIVAEHCSQASDIDRESFNAKFNTITYEKSSGDVVLKYDYKNGVSQLITMASEERPRDEFEMLAKTGTFNSTKHIKNIDFGLQTRGTDLALETGVNDIKAKINEQEVDYTYSDGKISIENLTTTSKTEEKMYLYISDYTFRIEDYKEVEGKNDDYKEIQGGLKEESELEVKVKYYLKIANQAYDDVSEIIVDYIYDSNKLEMYDSGILDAPEGCTVSFNDDRTRITCNNLAAGNSAYIYLEFTVKKDDKGIMLEDIENKAEIVSYTTEQGYIDIDSQPGNCAKNDEHEDDCATSKLEIKIKEDDKSEIGDTSEGDTPGGDTSGGDDTPNYATRKIKGYVYDDNNSDKSKVNDVIVQLIELKNIDGITYEYIWQETVSGTGKGKRFKDTGTDLEEYTYTKENGKYEFEGFIPGDYIVRFIYGDGTTYDMTENVIKYNGQDYKSTTDLNYQAEWYNNSGYSVGASVARDNEARRLETMAYSVNVDAEKGMILKLLDTQDVEKLNEVEKKLAIDIYNNKYPDNKILDITNDALKTLLKEETLENTWMCAETSKIKVPVDTESLNNTGAEITVLPDNITKIEFSNVNFGLEERPQTKIELKKYITGFKLTASNGQTLANAVVDVGEYYENPGSISEKIQGIKDNLVITNTFWSYEVSPTELSTIVEGANLEFVYDLVVENHSDIDYLSAELINAYNNDNIDYAEYLRGTAGTVKNNIKNGLHKNGAYLGNEYYIGGTSTNKVQTEVTRLKDYVNDNLRLIGVNLTEDEYEETTEKHYVLNDAYGLDEKEVKTLILKGTSEKLTSGEKTYMSKVTLGKDAISTSGKLEVDTYIAEVMAYTNAAGRRANTTPANAGFVSKGIDGNEARTHEKDEADTARIQIGSATGEDEKTPYVWLIAVTAGIAIIGIGAIITKKYIMK